MRRSDRYCCLTVSSSTTTPTSDATLGPPDAWTKILPALAPWALLMLMLPVWKEEQVAASSLCGITLIPEVLLPWTSAPVRREQEGWGLQTMPVSVPGIPALSVGELR